MGDGSYHEYVIGHKLQFGAANGLIGPTIGPILKVFATLQSQYDFTVSATSQNLYELGLLVIIIDIIARPL